MDTPFTPWSLFIDIGIISVLLLTGKLLRVKVRFLQRLFIPPSLMAGFIGLILGRNGFDLIPLSCHTGVYASILIALIFAALPLTSHKSAVRKESVGSMWAYSQTGMLLQWGLGGTLGLLLLSRFRDMNPGFGITMPAGFCGGHGTAAAIGSAFSQLGHDEILSLSMTAATLGIVASVIIGLIIIRWGTRNNHTAYLENYNDLSEELRTGLVEENNRQSIGSETCSSISIDSVSFNLAIICLIALCGYGINKLAGNFSDGIELPVFSCAFIVSIMVKSILRRTSVIKYTCPKTIGHLSNTFTDYLVAFGIASIKLSVVVQYIVPLCILLSIGLFATLVYVIVVARILLKENWFEKAIFTWGWFTGTMAMGIALLRIVDPSSKSKCMDNYAIAYLFIAPVEILLISISPVAFLNGYGIYFSIACLIAGIAIMVFSFNRHYSGKRELSYK